MAKRLASFDASLLAVYAKRDNGEENDDNIVNHEYFVYGQKKERYFT